MKKISICLLLALAVAAFATDNMVANPRFEERAKNGAPVAWQFKTAAGNKDKISYEVISDPAVKGKVLHISTIKDEVTKDGNWMFQMANVKPQNKYVLEFDVKAFAHNNELDHSVNAGVSFHTAENGWISYKILGGFAKHSDKWKNNKTIGENKWKRVKFEFTTPPLAEKVGIRLNVSGAGAEAFFADFKLSSPFETVAGYLDRAAVPAEFKVDLRPVSAAGITVTPDWSLNDAEKVVSATRSRVCLNGLWAFMIPGKDGKLPENIKWSFFKVPGRPGDSRNPFEIYGNHKYDWKQSTYRWLWRTVSIPADAPEMDYYIDIDLLTGAAAKVIWNGEEIGKISDSWGGEVAIPARLLKRGGENTLAILLAGQKLNETTMHVILAGKAPDIYEPSYSMTFGNVYLTGRPAATTSDAPRITTSFRRKTLTAEVPGSEAASYDIEVRDQAGKTVFAAKKLAPQASGRRAAVSAPWADPVLWSPAQPNLLYLTLTAYDKNGRIIDQSLPERFGFRELWTEGRFLKFNGMNLRLRPRMGLWGGGTFVYRDFAEKGFAFLKDMGFNMLLRSGTERGEAALIQSADEVGFFCMAYMPTALADGGQFGDLKTQAIDDTLMDYLDSHNVRRFHNNPSVIAYSGFGAMMPVDKSLKYSNYPGIWGIKPVNSDAVIAQLIKDKVTSDTGVLRRQAAAISFIRGIRKLDASRLFLGHVGCGTGDGWGSFDYLNWLQWQEWEDYVIDWTRKGIQPIGSTEHGHPYPMSFVNHGVPDGDREPWHTEYIAGRLGPESYQMERPEFRELIKSIYNPAKKNYTGGARHTHSANAYTRYQPAVQTLWKEQTKRIYRSWRFYGVNMGLEPFGDPENYVNREDIWRDHNKVIATGKEFLKQTGGHPDRFLQNDYFAKESLPFYPNRPTGKMPSILTPLGKALYENNHEFLGFIADTKERPTAKTHIYAPGEEVAKNLALIWDGLSPVTVEISGEIEYSGRKISTITRRIELKTGDILLEPFKFTIPADAAGTPEKPGHGEIRVIFKLGERESTDSFSFSVVGTPAKVIRKVALFDPANTADGMRKFAAPIITDAAALASLDCDLLMIAPNALTTGIVKAIKPGTPVIVLAQSEATLLDLGFKTHPIRSRQLWPDHSFNVDPELLRDWRAGRPFNDISETKPWRDGHNNYIGSTGMIAAVVIEVPHFGGYTPWVHGEFDLAQTAMLETVINGAPWLFCQLTLAENAGIDPAAGAIAAKLLNEFAARKSAQLPVYCDSDLAGVLGLTAAGNAIPERGIYLADKLNAAGAETLLKFVRNGGTAVVMPQEDAVYHQLKVEFKRTKGALFPVEFRGLNQGNLHYRQELPVVAFDGKVIAERSEGKGKMILAGFDPRKLNVEKEPYLTLTARRQYRTLSQLLVNAGAEFEATGKSLYSKLMTTPFKFEIPADKAFQIRATENGDQEWLKNNYQPQGWRGFNLSQVNTGLADAQIRIPFAPGKFPADALVLDASSFDDFDICYLNGVKIGETSPGNSDPEQAWRKQRVYPIPAGLLKADDNVLAIRVWNRNGQSKGWKALIRGPLQIRRATEEKTPYFGKYRVSDDPYQLYQW